MRVKACKAKTKLLILDCCHARAAGGTKALLNPAASLQDRTPALQMLLSCLPGELSLTRKMTGPDGQARDCSVFTRALVQGLEDATGRGREGRDGGAYESGDQRQEKSELRGQN